jgi:rhodanese-related sulfurtransferase
VLTTNPVTAVPARPSSEALEHFERLLAFETDCWDVHDAMSRAEAGFVLLDVRSPERSRRVTCRGRSACRTAGSSSGNLAQYRPETLFVVYCAGPHCNGATRPPYAWLAWAGPVKKMIGGVEGWKDEGFSLVQPSA